MDMTTVSLVVLLVIATSFAWFFGSEYKKKTGYALAFFEASPALVARYEFPGVNALHLQRGMHTIVLTADKPFQTMIGIKITIPLLGTGYDPFAVASSRPLPDGRHVVVHRTYFGNGAASFRYVHNLQGGNITISVNPAGVGEPSVVTPPHWFQRLGIFG